ncbi:MAG: TlpA family protein disulfide reductase [Terriglobales bacterium]
MRRILHLAPCLLLALALGALAGCSSRARPGRAVPGFHLTLLNGQKVTLASFRGRVVVLNFWASWCAPCVEETPALNALAQDFPNGRVVVLGVSIDEDPVAYRTFLARFGIHYPTARDPTQAIMHRYGTRQIPETYIIGPDGRLARKLVSVADFNSPTMLSFIRHLAGIRPQARRTGLGPRGHQRGPA